MACVVPAMKISAPKVGPVRRRLAKARTTTTITGAAAGVCSIPPSFGWFF
jgi:hypothetical protein